MLKHPHMATCVDALPDQAKVGSVLKDAKSFLADKEKQRQSDVKTLCGKYMRYTNSLTGSQLPAEWGRSLAHLSGCLLVDCNAIEQSDNVTAPQVRLTIDVLSSFNDAVGLFVLPWCPVVSASIQFQVMSEAQTAGLKWRTLTGLLSSQSILPAGQSAESSGNTAKGHSAVLIMVVGKFLGTTPSTASPEIALTMHQRISQSTAWSTLFVDSLDQLVPDSPPKRSNGSPLWDHCLPKGFWTTLLGAVGAFPLQSGDFLLEVEASHSLSCDLLDDILSGQGQSQWLGFHYHSSPAKKQYIQTKLDEVAKAFWESEKSMKSVDPDHTQQSPRRSLHVQKSDTDDVLRVLAA